MLRQSNPFREGRHVCLNIASNVEEDVIFVVALVLQGMVFYSVNCKNAFVNDIILSYEYWTIF